MSPCLPEDARRSRRRWPLGSCTRTSRDGVVPALERVAVVGNWHSEGLRRELDRDQRGDIRSREPIARHELDVLQPRFKIGVYIRHPLLATLDQRPNLLVRMRTGYGATIQACGGGSHSLHAGGEALKLRAAFPH